MKKDNRLTNYAIGYATCILLTLIAYLITGLNYYRNWAIIAAIATLAFVQFVIQIVFFLHLSKENMMLDQKQSNHYLKSQDGL